jgi:hypothetical protein
MSSLYDIARHRVREDVLRASMQSTGKNWRVLLVDDVTMPVVSASVKVPELMDFNVTLIENVAVPRPPLPTMDAVYFVAPTRASLERVAKDFGWTPETPIIKPSDLLTERRSASCCAKFLGRSGPTVTRRYRAPHLYLSSSLPDDLFDFVKSSGLVNLLRALVEVQLEFAAPESRVFTISQPHSFYHLFSEDPRAQLARGNQELNIVRQLATLVASVGQGFPAIRYDISSPLAASTATRLSLSLAEQVEAGLELDTAAKRSGSGSSAAAAAGSALAPLVLVLDRGIDLLGPLLHEITYQAFVTDVLGFDQPNVTLFADGTVLPTADVSDAHTAAHGAGKQLSLDESDPIFVRYRHQTMDKVLTGLPEDLRRLAESEEVAALSRRSGGHDEPHATATAASAAQALRSMPAYQRLTRLYAAHVELARAAVTRCRIDTFHELRQVEQQLSLGEDADGRKLSPQRIQGLVVPFLSSAALPRTEKLRLIMTANVSQGGLSPDERESMVQLAGLKPTELRSLNNLAKIGNHAVCCASRGRQGDSLFSQLRQRAGLGAVALSDSPYSRHFAGQDSYVPIVSLLVKQALDDTLSRDEYPTVPPPDLPANSARAPGATVTRSTSSAAPGSSVDNPASASASASVAAAASSGRIIIGGASGATAPRAAQPQSLRSGARRGWRSGAPSAAATPGTASSGGSVSSAGLGPVGRDGSMSSAADGADSSVLAGVIRDEMADVSALSLSAFSSSRKLIVFVLGGATLAEVRSAYAASEATLTAAAELGAGRIGRARTFPTEVFIGATELLTPGTFLDRVAELSLPPPRLRTRGKE